MPIDPHYASDKSVQLSGNTYVSAVLREQLENRPLRPFRVRLSYHNNASHPLCKHGVTICATWECLESWSIDYAIFLSRTGAGREIATKLHIDPYTSFPRKGIEILHHEDFVIDEPRS